MLGDIGNKKETMVNYWYFTSLMRTVSIEQVNVDSNKDLLGAVGLIRDSLGNIRMFRIILVKKWKLTSF